MAENQKCNHEKKRLECLHNIRIEIKSLGQLRFCNAFIYLWIHDSVTCMNRWAPRQASPVLYQRAACLYAGTRTVFVTCSRLWASPVLSSGQRPSCSWLVRDLRSLYPATAHLKYLSSVWDDRFILPFWYGAHILMFRHSSQGRTSVWTETKTMEQRKENCCHQLPLLFTKATTVPGSAWVQHLLFPPPILGLDHAYESVSLEQSERDLLWHQINSTFHIPSTPSQF